MTRLTRVKGNEKVKEANEKVDVENSGSLPTRSRRVRYGRPFHMSALSISIRNRTACESSPLIGDSIWMYVFWFAWYAFNSNTELFSSR